MDAEHAWSKRSAGDAFGSDADQTRLAVGELRRLLAALEARLIAPAGPAFAPERVSALVEALQALGRRIERLGPDPLVLQKVEALALRLDQQAAEGAAAARDQEARLAARLDAVLGEISEASTARNDPWAVRATLAAASAAAAVSVMAAAVLAVSQPRLAQTALDASRQVLADLPLRPGLTLSWNPARPTFRAALPPKSTAPTPGTPADRFEDVAQALERGDATALPRLTGLADAGDGRAQLQLAGLYESGGAGLARDLPAARLWTRRAAESGQRIAMHNLALFLSQGDGGLRDYAEAAQWFRRAADQGVVDSQYNLGLLYESGRGVDRNLREAYRWYSIAANAGDLAAREKAVALEAGLKPAERSAIDRAAVAFQPGTKASIDLTIIIPPATTLAETQALLVRQGYYLGPIDGLATPALRSAVAAYQRDHPKAQAKAATP